MTGVLPLAITQSHNAGVGFITAWAASRQDACGGEVCDFGSTVESTAVPAIHRRRLGRFGRLAVRCVLGVIPEGDFDLIFASRHGDTEQSLELVKECNAGHLLSPTSFSLSVHNAVAGIIDRITGCLHGHTAIASLGNLVSAGLIEVHIRLSEDPNVPVVLVIVDCPLPEFYRPIGENADFVSAHAMALRVESGRRGGGPVVSGGGERTLSRLARLEDGVRAREMEPDIGELIEWFHSGNEEAMLWRALGSNWVLRAA